MDSNETASDDLTKDFVNMHKAFCEKQVVNFGKRMKHLAIAAAFSVYGEDNFDELIETAPS